MPDGTRVNTSATASQVDAMDYMRKTDIFDFLEHADKGDKDSRHMLKLLMDQALKSPLSRIKQYLGENPDVSGGTIGNPIIQPAFVGMLRAQLCAVLSRQGRLFFCPPVSTMYASKLLIANYLYEFTWR